MKRCFWNVWNARLRGMWDLGLGLLSALCGEKKEIPHENMTVAYGYLIFAIHLQCFLINYGCHREPVFLLLQELAGGAIESLLQH